MSAPDGDGGLSIGQRIALLEGVVTSHGARLDSIEDWRSELRGAFRIVTFALGTSVVSAVLALAAIVSLLSATPAVP